MFLLNMGIVTKYPTQTLPGREGLKSILFQGRFRGGGSLAGIDSFLSVKAYNMSKTS